MNLAGKKKQIVDASSFYQIERQGTVLIHRDSGAPSSLINQDTIEDFNGASYFFAPTNDKLRIVLGNNWDFSSTDENNSELENKLFHNNWPSPRLFYGAPIDLEECGPPQNIEEATGIFGSTKTVVRQKIVVKSTVFFDSPGFPVRTDDSDILESWINFVKRGVATPGLNYNPIISSQTSDNQAFYFDHYHEAVNPFTPEELEEKSPTGKAFFAKYKTYYNERTRGIGLEKNNSRRTINSINQINNSLPSIYSFLKVMQSKQAIENQSIDFSGIKDYIKFESAGEDLYKLVLKYYPFLSNLFLFGELGNNSKIVEQIMLLSFNNFDADKLFSDYYREYTDLISTDPKFKFASEDAAPLAGGLPDTPRHRIRALENIMTNLVFSPAATGLLNKVDQYKDRFPSYFEVEFTANLFTQIGDLMKKFHITKIMSDVVLSSLKPPDADRWSDSFFANQVAGETGGFILPIINNYNFVDYFEEKTFDSLANLSTLSESGNILGTVKKTIDFASVLEAFNTYLLENDGVFTFDQDPASDFKKTDLRNYTTYFKSDAEPQVDINQGSINVIFKKLFFNSLLAKIVDTYNNHKRDYQQIMDGVPAYTEDLFYRIEKIKILGDQEEVIQNILIPNTSDLDIVKYVDTQVKYSNSVSDNIKYKYNIYTHRLVFGSKYRYYWTTEEDNRYLGGYTKRDVDDESPYDYTAPLGYGLTTNLYEKPSYTADEEPPAGGKGAGPITGFTLKKVYEKMEVFASVNVEILPSIQLVEDLLFTTPEIIILDRPPVPPEVELVPYRAVNNRIKILLSGATDRYRDMPIQILETDADEFDRIIRAQISPDGMVEFGSDDPVSNFQIFRTQTRPNSYSDFSLYDQISQGVYEENIFPNTKYYYTFRAIDDSGHISNPTVVYEVELIDERGAVRPIIRTIDMQPKKATSQFKECQKYMYLKPKLKQLYLFDQLGENSIFSEPDNKKRFKVRLTSKGSGKKIDINFSFKRK